MNKKLSIIMLLSCVGNVFSGLGDIVECLANNKGTATACLFGGAALAYGGKWYRDHKKAVTPSAEAITAQEAIRIQEEGAKQARDLYEYLHDFGGDFDGNSGQTSPLVEASGSGNLSLVNSLIEAGANVNKKLSTGQFRGKNALYFAAKGGHPEVVKALLAKGADNINSALKVAKEKEEESGTFNGGAEAGNQTVINLLKVAVTDN